MHIQIVLFDGFDLLDVTGPYEVFVTASIYSNEKVTVEFVSAEGERNVTSGVQQFQIPTSGKVDVSRSGIILIPGAFGSMNEEEEDSIPSRLKQASQTELGRLLKEAIQTPDIILATVCSGSLILAMNDLLENRHAVTHPLGMDVLKAKKAIPINARIVDDGDLVTSGIPCGLDISLYLVERELGPQIAHAVEQLLQYERRGTVWQKVGDTPKEL
ncbi:DJ-1/PfpI family protein [Priestia taiwanensis]|uniref:Glutamine amidotransferase n=1 Tax=Priestia taiwanensis TaxID=1347902 RepID=A0A917AJ24_9BACI|nr:DJ-1/PfpI family protein [Priestia taiwanensis]MBM7361500.1 transcriptional regulator GlxA family with amidase domain [Priestia taiwanensis]GGE54672.1 glutamine amidotransferase [Priestia taiwanensis]